MLPPLLTPGTPWQNTQLLTYSSVPGPTSAGLYFTPSPVPGGRLGELLENAKTYQRLN